MGRYFFDIEETQTGRDEEGSSVADAHELRSMAVELLGQILQDKGESFWENPDLRLRVRDERNNVHLRMAVSGTLIAGIDSDHLGRLASALREIEGQ